MCVCVCDVTVKEKSDAKPRQHTIDLSQMAVPIPVTAERRQSPEPSGQSAGDTDAVTEYIPIGNINTSLSSDHTPNSSYCMVTAGPEVHVGA